MVEIVYMDLPFIFSGISSSFLAYKYGILINSLKKIQEISSRGINLNTNHPIEHDERQD